MLDSLQKETAEGLLDRDGNIREALSGYTLVYMTVLVPAFIYTLLGAILVYLFGVQTDAQIRMVTGALITLGLTSFFTNVGRSSILEEVMNGLNGREDGSKNDFGKYMIFLVFFETLAIYGLLIFQLGLIFSGVMEGETGVTMEVANNYSMGAVILGLSASCSLLMGRLFNRLEGPLKEDPQLFVKKCMYLGIGHIPALVGLVIAIFLMIEGGVIG